MHTNIAERDFSCTREGLTIRGREFLPAGDHLPAIIVSHGFGGNSKDLYTYCQTLASWGYAAYCFDFCGGSAPGQGTSDGATTEMTVLTERADLLAVMDYVKGLDTVDANKITLMGFSQGGFVSALAAAKRPNEVEALILIYPALCIPDHARKGALAGASYDVNHVPEVIDCGHMQISKRFHDAVVEMDPFEQIVSYKGPVLLMHGTDDQVVNYTYAVKAKESYAPEQCHLQLIQEAGHSFTENQSAGALVSIQQFLQDKKEILTIHVQITGQELRKEDGPRRQIAVLFTGNSDSPYFKGHIIPGAEDLQEYTDDQLVSMRADYTLEGTDYTGEECRIHIVNQNVNGEWKPAIETDSKALVFLNQEDLTAVLEGYTDGLTVRIYSAVPDRG
ncbi:MULTISPECIES: alpha/beta fold hydrolase [unclassified Paenibacillus]|uniref:alpha/beta hydrolase n=1 Tax=unclassified Paenibacillus TaxID=185978 RepID=UPI002405460D|nr:MULTISPECIES: alpha/beta fold hydrolase [unclassified Paenibacillus]MDF9842633.1 dienelactone hydrolase [Paenibacillus sp. PastF-2]MDF9849160.1 dienelactone hydrolase [Paenibacillus sp. PastM-2]MDF9855794.1 dienelactone hydrolase [Paenibacillus sp. PastF-1]MDH6481002.1 dienelactone hydrolase [Paenibacillus sp. PastH-2]MDH6508485.1 dienelactone hydrolase [Paenibacillus sp. PastM-3]